MSRVRSNLRDMQTMRSFDVDGIVSDFPDRLWQDGQKVRQRYWKVKAEAKAEMKKVRSFAQP
jgi:hypothetical protein